MLRLVRWRLHVIQCFGQGEHQQEHEENDFFEYGIDTTRCVVDGHTGIGVDEYERTDADNVDIKVDEEIADDEGWY